MQYLVGLVNSEENKMNLGEDTVGSCSSFCKTGDRDPEEYPNGLRVLLADGDHVWLDILETMLKMCNYTVTKCSQTVSALKVLRENKDGFDLVMTDVHMPDVDGFILLEQIRLTVDLPVILMSEHDDKDALMKGITLGACDFLVKPIGMEILKHVWKHVLVRKRNQLHNGKGNEKRSKKSTDDESAEERDERQPPVKKPRFVWSSQLHQQFVNAVNQLGIDKAGPKKILKLMNNPMVSQLNVASHLQKYRLDIKRGSKRCLPELGNTLSATPTSHNGLALHPLTPSSQLLPQNLSTTQAEALDGAANTSPCSMPLLNQKNSFGFGSPETTFLEGQQQHDNNNKQVNLLHGIPTNMDSEQSFNRSRPTLGRPHIPSQQTQRSALLEQQVQLQSSTQSLDLPLSVLGQNQNDTVHGWVYISSPQLSSMNQCPKLRRYTFPLATTVPSFNARQHSNTVQHRVSSDQSKGFTEIPPSVDNKGLSNAMNDGEMRTPDPIDNSLGTRREELPDMGSVSRLFSDQFNREDIMVATLEQNPEGMASNEMEFNLDDFLADFDNLPGTWDFD